MAEFGIVSGLGPQNVVAMVQELMTAHAGSELAPPNDPLPDLVRIALGPLLTAMLDLNGRIKMIGTEIIKWHRANETSRRLETIPGFGAITASAVAATVSDPSVFESGREFAAWLGLTPRQNSSGGKQRLGGITKRGDGYIRTLLVIGATAVIRYAKEEGSAKTTWIWKLLEKKPARVVAVALANKMARIAWALMTKRENYRAVPA